jgi:ribosomal protein S18 acetylase RimI-like enzyme
VKQTSGPAPVMPGDFSIFACRKFTPIAIVMEILSMDLQSLALVAPLFDAYRVFYEQPSDPGRAERFLSQRLAAGESVVFWARSPRDGACMGFTQLYPIFSSMRTQKNWLLNDLYVAETFRREGVAEALIRRAMDFACSDGAVMIKLETAVTNTRAQRLYEKIGFRHTPDDGRFLVYQKALP